MEKVGDYLKRLREEKGLSLEDIFDRTRIKVRFLEKIELNAFKEIGGTGYTRMMVVTYGRELDADLSKVVYLYNSETSSMDTAPKAVFNRSSQPKKVMLSTRFFFFLFLAILVIALGWIVFRLYKQGYLDFIFWKNTLNGTLDSGTTEEPPVSDQEPEQPVVRAEKDSLRQPPPQTPVQPEKPIGDETEKPLPVSLIHLPVPDYTDAFVFNHRDSPLNVPLDPPVTPN